MESKNRNRWIIVITVAVAVTLCCCVVVAGSAIGSWLFNDPIWAGWGSGGVEGAKIDRTYDVGPAPALSIDNFSGDITVRAGDGNRIELLATRHARRSGDLERIEVDIRAREGQLSIVTKNPEQLRNARVRLELTVPERSSFELLTSAGRVEIVGLRGGGNAETSSGRVIARDLSGSVSLHTSSGDMSVQSFEGTLNLHVSSGSIDVQTATGKLDAHTSSGTIRVRDAEGTLRLDTSSGSIDYRGSPAGECSFSTGSGSIDLRLPSDLEAKLDLQTSSGAVTVGFALEGEQTRQTVVGTIGSGRDATIFARTNSGSIRVTSQ